MDTQTAEKTLDTLMGAWDGEEIIVRRDQPTGATIIIAVHSTRLGPACGGTRMKTYPTIEEAVLDAQRLAEGMTFKFAAAGLQRGGGKAVIAVPAGLDAASADGERLRERDILYAPDFVVNSGGAIYLIGREVLGWSEQETLDRIRSGVRDGLTQVYALADEQGITTSAAAEQVARQRIAGGQG